MPAAINNWPPAGRAGSRGPWLESQPRILTGTVRPVVILNAADPEMRSIANRRGDQAQFLTAWGAEMLRVHLDQVEKTDFDTPAHRKSILAATGGIPAEILKLIRQMALADDPGEVVRNWEIPEALPQAIV